VRLRFNEAKATEAGARLIEWRGGKMSYMKLIKLLYLADREALLRWGRPITTDRYVSMDHGPVVSNIYEIVRAEPQPGRGSYWRRFVSAPDGNYDVSLLASPDASELSQAEESLLREVFASHGGETRWQLVDFCHTLPEWQDPEGSAFPIEYRDILQAAGKTKSEIAAVEQEIDGLALADALLTPV
jgi:uncharacterized phage-associated protein